MTPHWTRRAGMDDLIERARAEVDLRRLMFGEDRTKWSRADRMTEELLYALEAAREDVRHLEPWRDAVFDGVAVFAALNRNAKPRTSPENVADTLDAVANVARSAIDQARGKGGVGK